MKNSTFTKGPWKVSSHITQVHSEQCGRVATLERFTEESTTRANARLIAAAPELLEQCKFLEKVLTRTDHPSSPKLAELRELLAKVEGEE